MLKNKIYETKILLFTTPVLFKLVFLANHPRNHRLQRNQTTRSFRQNRNSERKFRSYRR